jgi:hypothetical protein
VLNEADPPWQDQQHINQYFMSEIQRMKRAHEEMSHEIMKLKMEKEELSAELENVKSSQRELTYATSMAHSAALAAQTAVAGGGPMAAAVGNG